MQRAPTTRPEPACRPPGRVPSQRLVPTARAGGHTLIELVTALAIVGILVLGMASAVLMASRAVDPRNPQLAKHAAAEAAERLARELQFATAFNQRSGNAVTFVIPDRRSDGDTAPESVRYAWSGTAGDPLTREYNGSAPAAVIDDVREFALAYHLDTVTEQPSATQNESGETLLAGHVTSTNSDNYNITEKEWLAQYFQPSLPGDAVSWRVTRVLFRARTHGGTGGIAGVELRLPTASNLPSNVILEQIPMYESRLTDWYLWREFTFTNVAGLSPGRGLCLVISCILKDSDLADVQFDKANNPGGYIRSNDAGATWEPDNSRSMLYAVYGKVTTTSVPAAVTRTTLRGIGIRLRAGPNPATAVETAAPLFNAPEVTN